jgi:positive regulator of sigma E activity
MGVKAPLVEACVVYPVYLKAKANITSTRNRGIVSRRCQLQSLCEESVSKTPCGEETRVKVFASIRFLEAFFKYVNKGEKEKVRISIWVWRT